MTPNSSVRYVALRALALSLSLFVWESLFLWRSMDLERCVRLTNSLFAAATKKSNQAAQTGESESRKAGKQESKSVEK
jgi:hypothetical protein